MHAKQFERKILIHSGETTEALNKSVKVSFTQASSLTMCLKQLQQNYEEIITVRSHW